MFKSLRSNCVGADSKNTEGISIDEENMLWESKVLNVDTAKGLLRSVFFYNGKCFCLRGGQEHRDLGLSQLQRLQNPDHYVYTENSSKNRPGGFGQLKVQHKSVTIVANPNVGERCHVFLLDKYISKLPVDAIEKDLLYCRPLSIITKEENMPWYTAVPVGKNLLTKMVPEMCQEAQISGEKTNHSLRVSGASSRLMLAYLSVSSSKELVIGRLRDFGFMKGLHRSKKQLFPKF